MSTGFEWTKRVYYLQTEFVLCIVAIFILLVMIFLSCFYSYFQLKNDGKNWRVSFFSLVRPLFENIFQSDIAFTPARETMEGKGPDEGNNAALDIKKSLKVNIVLLGHEQLAPESNIKRKLARGWVHLYLILLCFIIVLWGVSIFSDSVLYRKMSSCNDISVRDTDTTCFLLSDEDIPQGIQEIIDGEKVPCEKVQEYIDTNNLTYDLEVICYQYHLNPIAAIGISYGAMKTATFVIVTILNTIFFCVNKYFGREPNKKNNLEENDQKSSYRKISSTTIVCCHVVFIVFSFIAIAIFTIVVAVIHKVSGSKFSAYDFLRGENFYSYSVALLIPVTILYLSIVPWWAFDPLEEPKAWDIDFSGDDKVAIRKKMNYFVHRLLLHEIFSTPLAILFDTTNQTNTKPEGEENGIFTEEDVV